MEYNKLGKTEIKVSPLCLGTGSLGVNMSDRDVDALLGSYMDGGGNFLDTAHIYSDWIPGERSRSERTLGRWLLRRGGRENLVIGTKGAHPEMGPHVKPGPQDRMAPEELTKDLEESLSFLKTDVIDIYWLHRDNKDYSVEEILFTLEGFVREGKIRYYACSNWTLDRIKEAQDTAEGKGWQGFCGNQIEWSCAKKSVLETGDPSMISLDKAFFDFHRESAMPLVPYASQAQGLYSKVETFGWEGLSGGDKKKYDRERNRKIYKVIKDYCHDTGMDAARFSLAYHLSQPDPIQSVPIIGTTKPQRVATSLEGADIRINPDIIENVNRLLLDS